MTENEAHETLEDLQRILTQYRHISKELTEANGIAILALEEIQKYKALGTVEELRIAKEKQIPKKTILQRSDEKSLYKCPCCDSIFVEAYENMQRGYIPKFCEMCGQSISSRLE